MWRFLKKLEIKLPYDPAIPLLGTHIEETKTERDTCTPVFFAALFMIARTWKHPRYPSADEWIRKLWYIYTMEYYSAIKKSTFKSVLMKWMKLEPIIQSEVSQKGKHQYSILTSENQETKRYEIFRVLLKVTVNICWIQLFYQNPFAKKKKKKSIYMEFRKMVAIPLYVRQQKRHRCIEQSFGLCGRGRGLDDLGDWD